MMVHMDEGGIAEWKNAGGESVNEEVLHFLVIILINCKISLDIDSPLLSYYMISVFNVLQYIRSNL